METQEAITNHLFDEYKQNNFTELDGNSLVESNYVNELKLNGDTISMSLIYQFDINTLFINTKNYLDGNFREFGYYIKIAIREAKKRNINIFTMTSSYGDDYFNNFLNKVESYINKRESMHRDLADKVNNGELSSEERTSKSKELQNFTIDKSMKISKKYNKMLIPILAGPIADPTVNSNIDKMRIFPFFVNEKIMEVRNDIISRTKDDEEEDNALKKEYYDKFIEQINNDIRLKQLKSLFKITNEDIQQKFAV